MRNEQIDQLVVVAIRDGDREGMSLQLRQDQRQRSQFEHLTIAPAANPRRVLPQHTLKPPKLKLLGLGVHVGPAFVAVGDQLTLHSHSSRASTVHVDAVGGPPHRVAISRADDVCDEFLGRLRVDLIAL